MAKVVSEVFVECVSCGHKLVLAVENVSDVEAAAIAKAAGWTVRGHSGAEPTRCGRCREAGRQDQTALDQGRVGRRGGYRGPYGPPRHP